MLLCSAWILTIVHGFMYILIFIAFNAYGMYYIYIYISLEQRDMISLRYNDTMCLYLGSVKCKRWM